MRANREAVAFAVNGTNLNFSIHIDGIALGPYYNPTTGDVNLDAAGSYSIEQNYERNVFYAPLSSFHLYSIPASRLRDPEFSRRATPQQMQGVVTDHGLKTSQVSDERLTGGEIYDGFHFTSSDRWNDHGQLRNAVLRAAAQPRHLQVGLLSTVHTRESAGRGEG